MNAIVPHGHEFRQSTDAAGLCGAIVKQTAKNIQGRRFVSCEGWQAIAIAHGCTASALDVERVNDEGMSGFKCVGVVRRMDDGAEIARAEGFLGDDENTWSKRPVYARRAMVQTRAISRACRSAFAHVVVMIDAGLSTTPAEEVPDGGFVDGQFDERQVSHGEPANSPPTEQPRWTEPGSIYSGISKLKAGLKQHMHDLDGCGDSAMIYSLCNTDEWREFCRVCELHAPWYLRGGEPAPPEFEGLLTKAERMVREFDTAEANQRAAYAGT